MERVGRQGHEADLGEAPGHVLDIGIQASVFMNHQDDRSLALERRRHDQIAFPLPVALGRGKRHVVGRDIRIVEGDLFGFGVVRQQGRQKHSHGQRRRCDGCQPIYEGPTVDQTVSILVVPVEGFLRYRLRRRGWPILFHGHQDSSLSDDPR